MGVKVLWKREYWNSCLMSCRCQSVLVQFVCKVTVCLRIYNIPRGFPHFLVVISEQSLSKPTAGNGEVVTGHCLRNGQKASGYHL